MSTNVSIYSCQSAKPRSSRPTTLWVQSFWLLPEITHRTGTGMCTKSNSGQHGQHAKIWSSDETVGVISINLMRAQLRSIINPQINECQWEQGVYSPIRKIQYNYIDLRAHVRMCFISIQIAKVYTITKCCKRFAKKWEWWQQHTNEYLNISYWSNALAWVFQAVL